MPATTKTGTRVEIMPALQFSQHYPSGKSTELVELTTQRNRLIRVITAGAARVVGVGHVDEIFRSRSCLSRVLSGRGTVLMIMLKSRATQGRRCASYVLLKVKSTGTETRRAKCRGGPNVMDVRY